MTGYTVHTGTNDKFAAGWDQIFSSGPAKSAKKAAKKKPEAAKAAKSAAPAKKAAKKVKRGK